MALVPPTAPADTLSLPFAGTERNMNLADLLGFKARAVANEFLTLAEESNSPLTPMKLMKLVYFAQGWSLALRHKPLFKDSVEAWRFGPVVRSVYNAFRDFGASPIAEKAPTFGEDLSDEERALVRRVWEVYKSYTASDLSRMSHDPNGPWAKALEKAGSPDAKNVQIENEEIEKYFAKQAARG